jgi:hypothetical protein
MDAALFNDCATRVLELLPRKPRYRSDLLVIAHGFDMNAAVVVAESVEARDRGRPLLDHDPSAD